MPQTIYDILKMQSEVMACNELCKGAEHLISRLRFHSEIIILKQPSFQSSCLQEGWVFLEKNSTRFKIYTNVYRGTYTIYKFDINNNYLSKNNGLFNNSNKIEENMDHIISMIN